MKGFSRASGVVAAIVLTLAWAAVGIVGHGAADAATSQATILPICSNGQGNTAQWMVTNPNATAVTVSWTTDKSAQSDTWTIPANDTNDSSLTTKFDSTDTTVKFVQNGVSQVISNLIPCEPTRQDTACIDASLPDVGLTETWTARNTVQIVTPDNVPICPGSLTLTSYALPTNYDGGFFPGNATSVPQTVFDSQTVTLTNTTVQDGEFSYSTFNGVTLTVKVPTDPCVNYRVSLNYGSTTGTVTTASYGNTYLGGGLYQATSSCVVSTPHVLGASTTMPNLTNTGINIRLTSVIAALLIAAAIWVFRRQPKAVSK